CRAARAVDPAHRAHPRRRPRSARPDRRPPAGLTKINGVQTMRFPAILAAGLGLTALPALAAPAVNEPAPGFTLTDIHGKAHSLGEYKGKIVVLEWLNHGCPFVRKPYDSGNMPSLQKE